MNINATILGQTIAFILFVAFCMKYVWPPLISAIEKRRKDIADSIASAERARKELELAQDSATDRLKQAKLEAQAIIDDANKRRALMLEEAIAEADQEKKKILRRAQIEIDNERAQVVEELRKHIATLAIASAEKIVEHTIDEAANSAIIDKLVAEL